MYSVLNNVNVSCHPCYSGQSCDYDANPITVIYFIKIVKKLINRYILTGFSIVTVTILDKALF